ncbi:MAG: 30S ribosomal protein S1 [Chloroflexi bacterium]|nr:30S ribosomal protein S1 [Chloroflexota bacterium]
MAQLLDADEEKYTSLERNQVVDGVIMKIDREQILVHVGQKTEGIIPSREMRSMPPADFDKLKVGDTLVVTVIRPEGDDGNAILSVDRARGEVGWRKLQEWCDAGNVIEGPVTGHNRGGAVVTVEGVQGFVPFSQLSSAPRPAPAPAGADGQPAPDLSSLVGKTLRLKVIEVSRKRNRVILSERAAMQEFRQQRKDHLLDELKEGDVRKGRISGLTNFGAFVDLGGADGLIHISELSWESVRAPQDVVKVGDEIDVYVIKIDKAAKRIALSLKRTRPEPWVEVAEKYPVGKVVEATVTKLATFGAFARLEGSVEGLIHISELADRMVQHPRDVVKEGERVAVRIVKVEPERKRIGLSMKQVREQEAEETLAKYRSSGAEQEGRLEQPALDSAMAAQLAKAMSAGERMQPPNGAQSPSS